MSTKSFRLLKLFFYELQGNEPISRTPEPTSEMSDPSNVEAFHLAGEPGELLEPIYIFNALRMSSMLKLGARVLDLGCGSAQAIRYLARLRPDVKITGIDLSEPMLQRGRQMLSSMGLSNQVTLIQGDMTDLKKLQIDKLDMISSIFSFHHLPSLELAEKCVNQIKALMNSTGCAFWCFDHVRPRSKKTAQIFPKIFSAEAPKDFQLDSTHSLLASFSFEEMRELFQDLEATELKSQRSRLLPFYQAHWVQRESVQNQPAQFKSDFNGQAKAFAWLMKS